MAHSSSKAPSKKGDLSNPNNWRGIVLMEITSKLMATAINIRLQVLLENYGARNQYGGLPRTGCQDAVFFLKPILQERKDKNLDTWALFMDLIKAFDTVNHEVIMITLDKFGCPDKLQQMIARLYKYIFVEIKSGKQK